MAATEQQADVNQLKQAEEIILSTLEKGRAALKSDFITGYAVLARAHGFNFSRGDVVLVHVSDVPKALKLSKQHDPVWVNNKLCEPGHCLFVRNNLKNLPLYSGLQS